MQLPAASLLPADRAIAADGHGPYACSDSTVHLFVARRVKDPNRLLMQTPYEALAEAREEIVALLEENRQLREEIQRLREKTGNGAARG